MSKVNDLILHCKHSIEKAKANESRLSNLVLNLPGYSSPKVKHLLNNLACMQGCRYLEVGVFEGSTFASALFSNSIRATAIDNWSEFSGSKTVFLERIHPFIGRNDVQIIDQDCFSVNIESIGKFSLYFYDGGHTFEEQEKAITFFYPSLDDQCILIVDDYGWSQVEAGTQVGLAAVEAEVLFEFTLPGPDFWNGIYVAVLDKKGK